VLEIDKAFFKSNDHYNAMEIAYRTWAELGRPTTRTGLSNVLEQTIKRTLERGHRYPPILLKRKRALDRGEWEPKVTAASSNATPEMNGESCPDCRGSGFTQKAGSGSLCPCGSWNKANRRNR
jgi:hypothetical protein